MNTVRNAEGGGYAPTQIGLIRQLLLLHVGPRLSVRTRRKTQEASPSTSKVLNERGRSAHFRTTAQKAALFF